MASPGYPGVFVNTSLSPLSSNSTIPGEATAAFALGYNIGPTAPTLVTSWGQYTQLYGGFNVANASPLAYAVYQYFTNGGSQAYVLRLPNQDATTASLTLDGIGSDVSTPILTVTATSPGAWGNGIYVQVTSTGTTGRVNFYVYNGGTSTSNLVNSYQSVSMNPSDPRYLVNMVNSSVSGSSYVALTPTLGSGGYVLGTTDLAPAGPTALGSGTDGSIAPALATAIPAGFSTLQNQVINLNVPGWTNTSDLNALIGWANTQQTVFMVVDAPFGGVPLESSATVAQNATTLAAALTASANAALYSPWLNIQDPASSVPGATVWVAPGGAVLGQYSYSLTTYGIQQSPAGIQAPVAAVQLEAQFTPTDLTNLETASVDPIRNIPSAGFCIFGARTLQNGFPSRYISIQRTIQQIVHDLTNITQFALFQPNDATLWGQIETVITQYLTQQMQANVLAGTTPATSFTVTCDSTNNTSSTAQAGIVNVAVAVALASPAEFIQISLQQFQGTTTATVTTS
jgi:phage tail sheath protein FI